MKQNNREKSQKIAKKSPSKQLKKVLMVRLRAKTILLSIAALVILISCGAGVGVIRYTDSGDSLMSTVERFNRNTASALGLTISEVLVTGRNELSRSELLAALKIRRGDPILSFNPHAARERLLLNGWIADVDVRRQLPNVIYVNIIEQKPAAIWQHHGKFKLIAKNGQIISKKISLRHKNLKVLVGEDAPIHAAELITMLESEYALMQQVSHATRVGSRRWNLLLKQGIDIRLPAEHAQIAWRYLATLQRKHKILQKKIRAVDLRIPNRLTLQVLKTKRPAQEGGAT